MSDYERQNLSVEAQPADFSLVGFPVLICSSVWMRIDVHFLTAMRIKHTVPRIAMILAFMKQVCGPGRRSQQ